VRRPAIAALIAVASIALLLSSRTAEAAEQPAARPLSLDEAITLALANNLGYRSAKIAVGAAEARLREAESPRLPVLAVRDTYQYANPVATLQTPIGSLPFSPNSTNVPLLALQYSLFDGGLTAARVGEAASGLAAARATERVARGEVIAAASKAYYDLMAAMRLADVANHAVDLAEGHLKQAQALYDNGQIPKADVLRAQTELANQRVNAIGAKNAVALAQVALDDVLNVPQTNLYAPTDRLSDELPAFNLDAILGSARTSRGEILAAEAAVSAARRAVDEARANSWPQVGVTLADGNTQPAVVNGYHNQFSVGLNAVWTLFDHDYTAGRIAAARSGVRQAEIALEQLRDGVELQVRQAYLNANEAAARVAAAKQLVTSADESLRVAQVRYRGGVGTALELQDAELQDISARQTLVNAEAALRESIVQLRFAAGLL